MTTRRLVLTLTFATLLFAAAAGAALAGPSDDAKRAAEAKNWQAAAEAWQKVLEKKPSNREAAIGLAKAVIEGWLTDAYPVAEEALHTVLEAKDGDRKARLALGDLYIAIAKSKSDPTAMKFTYEDAKTHFKKLVDADPADEQAAVGLARAHYWTAFYDDAVAVLDGFLAKGQSKGPALFWKGQVFYQRGLDAYRQSGEVDQTARGFLQKAKGAYEASGQADPSYFDTWMQLGYAAQYLGETGDSKAAYEKAMDLDAESTMPLKGIDALYYHQPDQHVDALMELAKEHPDNIVVHFFLGFRQYVHEDFDDAADSLKIYISRSKTPEAAFTLLGQVYDKQGETAKAKEAYVKALKANPDDETAAAGIDAQLRMLHGRDVSRSPDTAVGAAKAYEELLELAPNNPMVRNNLAFLLREAVPQGSSAKKWKPVLEKCVALYEEARGLVEELVAGRESTMPFERRFTLAGIVNDTGLMYQYYPDIKDYRKAEDYYLRALELTQDAYGDAFGNLAKIYLEEGKWQDAYDLARDCQDVARDVNGKVSPQYQELAVGIMERLIREGKAQD